MGEWGQGNKGMSNQNQCWDRDWDHADSQFESKSHHTPISFVTNSYQTDQHTREVRKMSTTGEKGSTTTKTPADFLKSIRGRPVVVKLNSGVDYRDLR
ncbi:hypothetical protein V6N13_047157 [Hibiscus sabdariffa]